MRFWDTSAVVPLLLEQPHSGDVRRLAATDRELVAWWGTVVECASAAARLRREERLTVEQEEEVSRRARALAEAWTEVAPSEDVRREAARLLRVHSLRAADALQLAAARIWAGNAEYPELVTYDERLGLAARLEGFRVLP